MVNQHLTLHHQKFQNFLPAKLVLSKSTKFSNTGEVLIPENLDSMLSLTATIALQ